MPRKRSRFQTHFRQFANSISRTAQNFSITDAERI